MKFRKESRNLGRGLGLQTLASLTLISTKFLTKRIIGSFVSQYTSWEVQIRVKKPDGQLIFIHVGHLTSI